MKKYWGSNDLNVKEQFIHRIVRLYPPYIVVLIIVAIYALARQTLPMDMISHVFSMQNFHWMITGYLSPRQPLTAYTWTLSIEMWCGLIWIFLLRYLSRKKFETAMYGMLFVGILYRIFTILLKCDVYIISLCPVAHFDAFAIGSLLAIREKRKRITRRIGWLVIIGAGAIVVCTAVMAEKNGVSLLQGYLLLSSSNHYLNNWYTGNLYLYISVFAAGIVGMIVLHENNTKDYEMGRVRQFLVCLGNNSYMLYLFHWPILVVLKHFIDCWWIQFYVVFIGSIIASFCFEKGYAVIHKKIWRRSK